MSIESCPKIFALEKGHYKNRPKCGRFGLKIITTGSKKLAKHKKSSNLFTVICGF